MQHVTNGNSYLLRYSSLEMMESDGSPVGSARIYFLSRSSKHISFISAWLLGVSLLGCLIMRSAFLHMSGAYVAGCIRRNAAAAPPPLRGLLQVKHQPQDLVYLLRASARHMNTELTSVNGAVCGATVGPFFCLTPPGRWMLPKAAAGAACDTFLAFTSRGRCWEVPASLPMRAFRFHICLCKSTLNFHLKKIFPPRGKHQA